MLETCLKFPGHIPTFAAVNIHTFLTSFMHCEVVWINLFSVTIFACTH